MSNPTLFGYLERPYLVDAYLTEFAEMAYGMQVEMTINALDPIGMQSTMHIAALKDIASQAEQTINFVKPYGMQTQMVIQAAKDIAMQATLTIAAKKPIGSQIEATINAFKNVGSQADMILIGRGFVGSQAELGIAGSLVGGMQADLMISPLASYGEQTEITINAKDPIGSQTEQTILGTHPAKGMSALSTNIAHWCVGYLERPYLVDPYLTCLEQAQGGQQVEITIKNFPAPYGMQVLIVPNASLSVAEQAKQIIEAVHAVAQQTEQTIHGKDPVGQQVERVINALKPIGCQAKLIITKQTSFGMQVDQIKAQSFAMQTTLVLYNTDKIRILSAFPSRGLTGFNWTANSTAPGDFSINNVNTDIVEQQWRSATGVKAGLILQCDTQGANVFIDTFAILNHNFTTSAVIVVQGYADAGFTTVVPGTTFSVIPTKRNANAYYIAPTLPISGARYWQINIDDSTNSDTQIKIGCILFGAAGIMGGDNITDNIVRSMVHFADKIPTEGFTDVMNDRALKFAVKVEFKNLDYNKGNYQLLDQVFQFARTSLKCLWIPDPKVPERFAVFGKLKQIPDSSHNNKGPEADYVDISAEVDESL